MGANRIFLVRHGESVWNAAGVIQGRGPAPGLTERGRAQARVAAESLALVETLGLWCSDAARARETATIIGSRLGLVPRFSPLLRERHWGSLQGAASESALAVEAGLGDDEPLPGGGESRREVEARIAEFVSVARGPVVVVTHGDVVAAAQRLWGSAGPVPNGPVPNGSVTVVEAVSPAPVRRG